MVKKTLAVLALGAALSIFPLQKVYVSDSKIFSYKEISSNPNKQSEEMILNFFNALKTFRELNFEKTWDMRGGLEFDLGFKFDYDIQVNPITFSPIYVQINLLFQYNF